MPVPALGPKLEPPRVYPRVFEPQPGSQVCLARVQVLAIPQEGCFTLLQPYPQDEKAIACVIFVERDHESASNYPHGNYRMVLSTECVQRRLGEPPRMHHPPEAQTPGSKHCQVWLRHASARVKGSGQA